jgi:hypothetical protein
MEFTFDKASNTRERLEFVRMYAAWVRRTPNAEWSRQQAVLVDSFYENTVNMPLSAREYLEKIVARRKSADRRALPREPSR